MIKNEDGTPVWEMYDDFLSDEEDTRFSLLCRYEVMLYLNGLESDFADQTPERRVMKQLSQVAKEEEKPVPALMAAKTKRKGRSSSKKSAKAKAEVKAKAES
jgi:hypothetical protein